MKKLLFLFLVNLHTESPGLSISAQPAATGPEYSIQAIRYANSPGFPAGELVIGAPKDEKVDIAFVVWLVRGGGHNLLFDSGFHREKWTKYFPVTEIGRAHV